ncbi:MAG: sugar phosphate isomerase/epimerase [Caldilineaceae bacterium]|uniref:Sugar phosphate isomerase/epimerase n=1 Tax=Caldilineaceae bacterium SB0675_bin_29 TaxID=2605266 RepID=A0A6B1FW37_9CHLR|nr:sugar phosphate isomerase/epimerase [Caldilineaceae bacterium]MYH60277.1 sugar phosphate isomerase/epimerase [Caldilineaceae bacterium SB0675_bin_29]
MRFILSTGSLYNYSVDRVFALAAEAGFDGIEMLIDHRWDTRQADYLQHLMESHSLPIPAFHSPFSRNCSGWGETEYGAIARTAELAYELGAQVVVHHLPMRFGYAFLQAAGRNLLLPNPFDSGRQYATWLSEGYAALQTSTDVLLCIENLPAVRFLGRRVNPARWNAHSRKTLDDIARFPHITLDTTHLGTWGLDPLEAYDRWGQRVKHVHLSNFDGSEHRRPEDGSLRLGALLSRMAADGYSYSISLELQPDALEAGAPDSRIVDLLRGSLYFCRKAVG